MIGASNTRDDRGVNCGRSASQICTSQTLLCAHRPHVLQKPQPHSPQTPPRMDERGHEDRICTYRTKVAGYAPLSSQVCCCPFVIYHCPTHPLVSVHSGAEKDHARPSLRTKNTKVSSAAEAPSWRVRCSAARGGQRYERERRESRHRRGDFVNVLNLPQTGKSIGET